MTWKECLLFDLYNTASMSNSNDSIISLVSFIYIENCYGFLVFIDSLYFSWTHTLTRVSLVRIKVYLCKSIYTILFYAWRIWWIHELNTVNSKHGDEMYAWCGASTCVLCRVSHHIISSIVLCKFMIELCRLFSFLSCLLLFCVVRLLAVKCLYWCSCCVKFYFCIRSQ